MAQTPLPQSLPEVLPSPGALRDLVSRARDGIASHLLPSDEQVAARQHRPTSMRIRVVHLLPKIAIGLAAILLIASIGLFVFRAMYNDRIYPAVVVGDVNVGGLTPTQAETRLTERAAELENGTVSFTYQGQTWTPTLAELGITVNLEDSITEAQELGRGGDAASRLGFTADILQDDQVVPLRTTINSQALNAWFDKVDRDIDNFAVDAQLVLDGPNVSISPDATGVVVDRDAATSQIRATLASLTPMSGDLPTMVQQPSITVSDLEQVKDEVQVAISKPVRIDFETKAWRIEGTTLSAYLTVETVIEDGKPVAKLSMDRDRLAKDLRTQFVPEVNREPVNAVIEWSGSKGGIVATEASQTGITLKAGAFADALSKSYLSDHNTVSIPVVETYPDIDSNNLGALGINSVLATGDSNFAWGPSARDANIYVATSLLDGSMVRPGGVFSFNEAIGEITADKGYQTAEVVVAEEVGRDIGGGVCQVSTTMFRAALLAGMPIVEWHPHTYRLSNYERDGWQAGYDASILQNEWEDPSEWPDFEFENFTDGWLLIQAYTSGPNVVVTIFGKETGRTVDLSWWGVSTTPEYMSTGFTRVIYDKDGNVVAERDFSASFKRH